MKGALVRGKKTEEAHRIALGLVSKRAIDVVPAYDGILKEIDAELAEIIFSAQALRGAIARRLSAISADERKAQVSSWEEWRKRRDKVEDGKAKAKEKFRAALKEEVRRELYDELRVRGKKIGDIWSNEFDGYRKAGAFEACLFDQLQKHAQPNKPTRVRDFVKLPALAAMVARAEKEIGGKYVS